MRRVFVFNGDADGLCALQQLCLAGDEPAELVSGPKRRTELLAAVSAGAGDEVTVLDVSFHANRDAVERLLAAGARVRYFDHHYAGQLPGHERLEAHIDLSPSTCTSAIVDRYLDSRHRAWAAVGAFGDNLAETGRSLAKNLENTEKLERLGVLLNYNSYGETEADLFFPPAELHRRLGAHADPLDFVRADPAYERLASGYAEDMQRARDLRPVAAREHAAVYVLPDASWARRVSGAMANRLARAAPARAHAMLSPNSSGGMQVSVRAPLERPAGAAALCLDYATGGGREAAAGINHLPMQSVGDFTDRFIRHFDRDSTR
ncbi:MAG TPA: acetyltransferase [Burkholderiales bacterium]|nr:acetyltransferase [Burkholderiales bacterium]